MRWAVCSRTEARRWNEQRAPGAEPELPGIPQCPSSRPVSLRARSPGAGSRARGPSGAAGPPGGGAGAGIVARSSDGAGRGRIRAAGAGEGGLFRAVDPSARGRSGTLSLPSSVGSTAVTERAVGERKTLSEMTAEEWEALCDGCGRCWVHKQQDVDTGELVFTKMACRALDHDTGRWAVYEELH